MNWKAEFALLLLFSTLVTYFCSLGIARNGNKKTKKGLLILSIIFNIGILFLFKYFNFFAESIENVLLWSGLKIDIPEFSLLLPVGISFYTFKALGYTIDVYRGNVEAEKDIITYALFVSFFPQLAAGPIDRANNLLPQLKMSHHFDYDRVLGGAKIMIWGYFLKLVLADRCGIYVDAIFNNVDYHNGGSFLIASLLFTIQIYGDFAGYSLIAIGVAKVIGYDLVENFRRPYFAASVGEFWHRWHISLSTWFRDYVYIPLGGNRVSKARCYFNLFITFLVSGIWHGANWTFFVWGALHGVLLCIEKAIGISKRKFFGFNKLVHCLCTFILVNFAWVFFRADSLSDAVTVITGIFTNWGAPKAEYAHWLAILIALIVLVAKETREEFVLKSRFIERHRIMADHAYIILMVCYIMLFGILGSDQFIYFQF